ncbi:hypothetical protein ABGB12_30955 [Actinocorallia sp. B10E7]|uniref:hypothetical protein n=1 Tax=Actinocorallia sp. B10E7 TaxID=3153558 RepID=UPI00325E7BDE
MPTRGASLPAALPFLLGLLAPAAVPVVLAVPARAAGPSISPADGSTVTARTVTIRVRAPESGGRLLVDGVVRDAGGDRELTYTLDGRTVPNGTHQVRFDALDGDDSESTFRMAARPAAPTGVRASVSGRTVTVVWDANTEPDITGYEVSSERGGASTGPCSGTCRASFDVPASASGALAVGVEAERAGATLSSPTSYNFVDLDVPAPAPQPQPQEPAPQPEPDPEEPSAEPEAEQPDPTPSGSDKPKPSDDESTAPAASNGADDPSGPAPGGTTPAPSASLPNWLGPLAGDPSSPPAQNPDLGLLPSLPTVAPSVPASPPALGLVSGRDPLLPALDEHSARGVAVGGVLLLSLTHLGLWSRRRRLAAFAPSVPPTAHERVAAERDAIESAVRSSSEATSGRARRRRERRRR